MRYTADLRAEVTEAFKTRYGAPPEVLVRAPGRVNLIGEHTDYNDGFVLPMALERAAWLALRARPDDTVTVRSLELGDEVSFRLSALERGEGWAEYLKGSAWALQEDGFHLRGFEGVLRSDVPLGAGLSSSAALELATMRAFAEVSGFPWEPKRMARLAQRTENAWVGAQTGIMDQLISACGEAGRALLIDCRSLETEAVALPAGTAVVIMDTATRHKHVESGYNDRRRQCEEAAAFFGVRALRDVSLADFRAREEALAAACGDEVRRRARHVVSENARTLAAAAAMRAGDAPALGRLMDESHASMQGDFEISSSELDLMVSLARQQPGCLGARMTGGGFAGCAVALVREADAPALVAAVSQRYAAESGLEGAFYLSEGAAGASAERVA
ncbi:galactokinase [Truepera radiovictrix]|uniref:Galactokinase n=1 Tax=Truepera radiovictrix (strain DSM 17093 / CIP 108686 / LMG 22925 / RQ-24) TaxID=649638 RepID=D7CU89_TRURR|nr:galactokinase [Truepera radiovictrix]ADI13987.1 galactokinase [Truepera radiovictrix DSM 17093]WMT58864.1 galactokinase [Truepera radiovictrix]